MNVLTLDLATRTGWALLENGAKTSGIQLFDVKRGESPGMRYVRFRRWIEEIGARADIVVYEQTIMSGPGSIAREIATGFATIVQAFCVDKGIDHAPVWASTLKKWTTGKGNADKAAMIEAVIRRGWFPAGRTADDNEIDAIALREYALEEIVPTAGAGGSLARPPASR